MNSDEIIEALESCKSDGIHGNFLNFKNFICNFNVDLFIENELKEILIDYKKPPSLRSPRSLNIIHGSWFAIDLIIYYPCENESTLSTLSSDSIFNFINPTEYQRFFLPENYNNNKFDQHIFVQENGRYFAKENDFLLFKKDKDVIKLLNNEPILAIVFTSLELNSHTWKFDAKSLQPIRSITNDPLLTVLEIIAKFIGLYGDSESVDNLNILLNHESFNIKWQAAQSLLNIDREEGEKAFLYLSNFSDHDASIAACDVLRKLKEIDLCQ